MAYYAAEYQPISAMVWNSSVMLGTATATMVRSYQTRQLAAVCRDVGQVTSPLRKHAIAIEAMVDHSFGPVG